MSLIIVIAAIGAFAWRYGYRPFDRSHNIAAWTLPTYAQAYPAKQAPMSEERP